MRIKIGRPRSMQKMDEDVITESVDNLSSSSGVSFVSLEVNGEGRRKCVGHHWHKVNTSSMHRASILKLFQNGKFTHTDYVCCKCTFGKCKTTTE